MLSMTAKTQYHRYSFEEVCFRYETNGFCSNYDLMVKRFNAVHDSQRPAWSVMMWRGLLQIWNQRLLQQQFLIVKRLNVVHDNQSLWSSVLIWQSLLRICSQRFLQQPCSSGETFQCCAWQAHPMIITTDLKRSASNQKSTVSATTIFLRRDVSVLSTTART